MGANPKHQSLKSRKSILYVVSFLFLFKKNTFLYFYFYSCCTIICKFVYIVLSCLIIHALQNYFCIYYIFLYGYLHIAKFFTISVFVIKW